MSYSCDEFTAEDYSGHVRNCNCADCRQEYQIYSGNQVISAPISPQVLPKNKERLEVPMILPTKVQPNCIPNILQLLDIDFDNFLLIALFILIIIVINLSNQVIALRESLQIISSRAYNH